ncbi:MAG: T9SS type A sorting domain-containing protein [Bacteroidetes bacterium]|nr:T9SS type A sorting domain-containing protein [Bacteroidota bacterium]
MKRTLLSVLACISFSTYAQIQITQANMPSINDTIRYSVAIGSNLDFVKTGANFHWDYSGLGLASQDIYKFQALTSTPYATLAFTGMPFGAIGYKIADSIGAGQFAFKNLYNFFDKKSTGWRAVGTGYTLSVLPLPAGGVYSDPDEVYSFPLNYNDEDSTTFAVTTILGNQFLQLGTLKQKGYRLNFVEGWGTITTPYGSNINCLKIKSVVYEIDSLKISTPAFNVGIPVTRVEYKWLSTTEKIPVLEVIGTELGGTFTPTQIRYRDNYRTSSGNNNNGPRVSFDADKYMGTEGKDTFYFINTTRPNIGNTYKWTFTPSKGVRFVGGTSSASARPIVVFDSAGVFTVKLEASNLGGTDDSTASNMITISKRDNNQSIAHLSSKGLTVYPNPVKDYIQLDVQLPAFTPYFIYDLSGKLLMVNHITEDNKTIDCTQLISGQYLLVIRTGDLILYTQIIKE